MGAGKTQPSLVDIREHVLYVGVTQTGKTTLARHHASILAKADYDLIVYDPVGTETANGTWPEKAIIETNPDKFLARVEKVSGTPERPVFVFCDEAADIFGHQYTDAHWIPRRIRHQNAYLRIIAQRPKMLHPNVRSQCAVAYVLRLSQDDARVICADFGHGSDVYQIPLDKGDCLLLISGSADIEDFNVFDHIGRKRQSTTGV
jgi:hypothetical protein